MATTTKSDLDNVDRAPGVADAGDQRSQPADPIEVRLIEIKDALDRIASILTAGQRQARLSTRRVA